MALKVPRVPTLTFNDFSTGVSEPSSLFAVMDNPLDPHYGMKAAATANNVIMNENGLEKFMGNLATLVSTIPGSPTITGVYQYKKTGPGAASYFLVAAGTKIYTYSAGSLTEIFPLSTGHTITAGNPFWFETYGGACQMCNGVDKPLYFDGTTCDRITFTDPDSIFGTATPSFVFRFRNRLLYGGDPTNPSRLWTPRPDTYNNFDNTLSTVDAFDVSPGDNYVLTGAKALSKDLAVIYKNGACYRLSGSNPFGSASDVFLLEEISQEIGCIAGRTITQVGRDQFFLSSNGFKRLTIVNDYGDVQDSDPSYEIKDEISSLNYTDAVIANAFAVYVKSERHIYLHVPVGSGTQNTQVYVYDIKTGSNMPRSGITASCGALFDRKYYTGDYAGQVTEQLINDDYNGAAIPSSWESKWVTVYGLNNKHNFKHIRIYFESSGTATITVSWQIMKKDGSTRSGSKSSEAASGDVWDVALWDVAVFDNGQDVIFSKNNLGRGVAIKLKITNNNAAEHWKVRKIEMGVLNLGRVAA